MVFQCISAWYAVERPGIALKRNAFQGISKDPVSGSTEYLENDSVSKVFPDPLVQPRAPLKHKETTRFARYSRYSCSEP
jgi:hypothetical protein